MDISPDDYLQNHLDMFVKGQFIRTFFVCLIVSDFERFSMFCSSKCMIGKCFALLQIVAEVGVFEM